MKVHKQITPCTLYFVVLHHLQEIFSYWQVMGNRNTRHKKISNALSWLLNSSYKHKICFVSYFYGTLEHFFELHWKIFTDSKKYAESFMCLIINLIASHDNGMINNLENKVIQFFIRQWNCLHYKRQIIYASLQSPRWIKFDIIMNM